MTDPAQVVREVLDLHTWAVVGLRQNPARPAYGVAQFLQEQGKRVVPVHRAPQDVFGEQAYPRLADIPYPVDVVDVFVNSRRAGGIADDALAATTARAVWFQLGVIDEAAAARVRDAGRIMVMNRCPAIEWPRLGLRG